MDTKAHLSMLINMAMVDGSVDEKERKMIYLLGRAHDVKEEEIDDLFKKPKPLPSPGVMTEDDKFECLLSLVQLMKVDQKIYLSEVNYCEEVATKLGFKKAVVAEISAKVYSDPNVGANRNALKKMALKYQNR